MKSEFDRWLTRHREWRAVPDAEALVGGTLQEQYWFRWPNAETFKDRLVELVACYPDLTMDSETEDSLAEVLDGIESVLREQVDIDAAEVPNDVMESFLRFKAHRSHARRRATAGSWRWRDNRRYWCFVNEIKPTRGQERPADTGGQEWSIDRLCIDVDYEGSFDAMTGIQIGEIEIIARRCHKPELADSIANLKRGLQSDADKLFSPSSTTSGKEETVVFETREGGSTVAGAGRECPAVGSLEQNQQRTRERDAISHLVNRAIRECDQACVGLASAAQIFLHLKQWAQLSPPKNPFFGVTDSGIQWMSVRDEPKELTFDMVSGRLIRYRRRAALRLR